MAICRLYIFLKSGVMHIGQRIKLARKRLGLKQAELAVQIGITQQSLSGIEAGKHQNPRNIEKYAKVLDVSPSWLQFGEGENLKAIPLSVSQIKKIPVSPFQNLTKCYTIALLMELRLKATEMIEVLLDEDLIKQDSLLFGVYAPHIDAMNSPHGNDLNINKNELLIFDANRKPKHEEIVLVAYEKQTIIRQFFQEGPEIIFKPLNPAYEILKGISPNNILGVLLQVQRRYAIL